MTEVTQACKLQKEETTKPLEPFYFFFLTPEPSSTSRLTAEAARGSDGKISPPLKVNSFVSGNFGPISPQFWSPEKMKKRTHYHLDLFV